MKSVRAYEVKTHLASLLERVEAGESIIITLHGKEVAWLVPPPGVAAGSGDVVALAAQWRKTRAAGVKPGGLKVRDLISDLQWPQDLRKSKHLLDAVFHFGLNHKHINVTARVGPSRRLRAKEDHPRPSRCGGDKGFHYEVNG